MSSKSIPVPVSPIVPMAISPPQSSKDLQALDKGFSIVVETLNALAKVPHAGPVCGPAAAIFDAAQKVRSNRAEYASLAKESCMLVYSIEPHRLDKEQAIDQSLQANLDQLSDVLNEIRVLTEKRSKRKYILAFLFSAFDIHEIKMQRQKLEGCMRLFQFRTLLELRQKTNQILEKSSGAAETTTTNAVTFGNGADFSNASGTAIGIGNEANVANTIAFGDEGNRNSNNYGANSGTQLFTNASHFMISGGEFNNVGGNSIRNSYIIDRGGGAFTY